MAAASRSCTDEAARGSQLCHIFFLSGPSAGSAFCAGKAWWYKCLWVAAALYSLYKACKKHRRGSDRPLVCAPAPGGVRSQNGWVEGPSKPTWP